MAAKPKKSFLLRVNPKLMARIEMLAAQELRSTNAQIEIMLLEGLKKRGIRTEVNSDDGEETQV